MPWLEYEGRLRKLPEGTTLVGSAEPAGLVIQGADLLPRHFWVEASDTGLRIRPHAVEAVVAIDGRQMGTDWCPVEFGATISAGSAHFRVVSEAPTRTSTSVHPRNALAFLVDVRHGLAYPLDHQTTNIGRARTNHVRLEDPTASRFHAQVRREAGGWALHPAGSSGAQVNGEWVGTPRLLEDGDTVDIAFQSFRFTRGAPPAGVRIVPRSDAGDPARSERPTIARERISMVPPGRRGRHPISRPLLIGLLAAGLIAAGALALLR